MKGPNRWWLPMLLTSTLIVAGCSDDDDDGGGGPPVDQPPTASFMSDCDDATLTCTFTDTSTDDGTVTAWAWDFGDGQTSDMQNPSATYAAAGTYTVMLTVTDDGGNTGMVQADVTLEEEPDPGVTVGTAEDASEIMVDLDPADIVVVGADPFSISFSLMGVEGEGGEVTPQAAGDPAPLTGVEKISLYVINESENDSGTGAPFIWTSHTEANGAGFSMPCTLTGMDTNRQGEEVLACTLVEDPENPGSYSGTWEHEGNAPVVLADGDDTLLHRVVLRVYGIEDAEGNGVSDKVLSAPLDFIPATGAEATSMKDTVANASCIGCHGALDGYPEGDDRFAYIATHKNYQKVENCVTCHTAALGEADFPVFVHALHSSITSYPGEQFNCLSCHNTAEEGKNSWETNVYGAACESCHTGFRAIAPHNETTPDSACAGCHGVDAFASSAIAHMPDRREVTMANDAFVVNALTAVVSDNGADDGMSTLTVTADVVINGEPAPDGTDLAAYTGTANLLINRLSADGIPQRGGGVTLDMRLAGENNDQVSLAGGVLTLAKDFMDELLAGPIYAVGDIQVCGDGAMAVMCDDPSVDLGADGEPLVYAVDTTVAYFNLTEGEDPITARIEDDTRVSFDIALCNDCHENLTHVKDSFHGVDQLTQCMHCHNPTWEGSFHPTVNLVNDDGTTTEVDGLTFANRDLTTVTHRYHSGNWDNEAAEGLYLNGDGELQGYPHEINDCTACHNGVAFNAEDLGLTSGKRSVAETDGENTFFVSPVAAACRSCHVSEDAKTHMSGAGGTFLEDANTDPNLPIEPCGTCHAEGQQFSIELYHVRPPIEGQDDED